MKRAYEAAFEPPIAPANRQRLESPWHKQS